MDNSGNNLVIDWGIGRSDGQLGRGRLALQYNFCDNSSGVKKILLLFFYQLHFKMKMEPLSRGKDFEFEDKIFGGAVPKNYIPSIEKGILEARKKGVLAGYPVVDFKVILYDGSYHEVDSSDIAFKIAASMAFKKGMKEARPTLLEPIMNVEVYTPDAYMGDIMGNLNGRRGKLQGMEQKGSMRILKAQVPMSEMLDFEPTLTSITGGRGSFLMEFSHYEEVPSQVQQKIISEAVKEGRVKPEEE